MMLLRQCLYWDKRDLSTEGRTARRPTRFSPRVDSGGCVGGLDGTRSRDSQNVRRARGPVTRLRHIRVGFSE